MLKGLSFITCMVFGGVGLGLGEGSGSHFFGALLIGSGESFSDNRSLPGGIILINCMKVGQSSNEQELKLNVTAVNS